MGPAGKVQTRKTKRFRKTSEHLLNFLDYAVVSEAKWIKRLDCVRSVKLPSQELSRKERRR